MLSLTGLLPALLEVRLVQRPAGRGCGAPGDQATVSQAVPGAAGGGPVAKRSGPFSPAGCSRSCGSPGTPAPALLSFPPRPLGSPWVEMVMGRPRGPGGGGTIWPLSAAPPRALAAAETRCAGVPAGPEHPGPATSCSLVTPSLGALSPRAGVPCAETRWQVRVSCAGAHPARDSGRSQVVASRGASLQGPGLPLGLPASRASPDLHRGCSSTTGPRKAGPGSWPGQQSFWGKTPGLPTRKAPQTRGEGPAAPWRGSATALRAAHTLLPPAQK